MSAPDDERARGVDRSLDRTVAGPEAEAPALLRETQRLLRALVTAPTGVHAALDGRPGVPGWLDAWPEPVAALDATVLGDARLSAPARLDVYAQGYFARLHEILVDDFETVAWLCGEAAFNDLVTAFLVAHPSRSPNLRELGRPFARFLGEHDVTAFARERWPGLADVARLEWAFAEVFDAPNEAVLQRAALDGLEPERFVEIPLAVTTGFELLRLEWPAGEAVSARRRGEPVPEPWPEARRHAVAVWREGERAVFRELDGFEAEALAAVVLPGGRFDTLCEWLAARTDDEGAAAARAAGWLGAWIDAGWLAALPERHSLR